jgi:hypothetical protein
VAALVVVIALHVLALSLFFLPARLPTMALGPAERETVLYLWRAPPPPVRRTSRPTIAVPRFETRRIWRSLPLVPPAQPSESQLQGVGADLFSCRPEDIGGLSLSQQTRCARVGLAATEPPPSPFARALHMAHRGRWETALALQKAPPLAPCFTHQGFSPLATAFCLAEMAIDGYDQDNHEKYYLGGP